MQKEVIFLFVILLSLSLVSAADYTPQGNIDMKNKLNISGVPYINGINITDLNKTTYSINSSLDSKINSNNVTTYNWVETTFLKIVDMFTKNQIVSMISGNRTQIENEISGNISSLNSSLDNKINSVNSSLQTNIDNTNNRITSVNNSLQNQVGRIDSLNSSIININSTLDSKINSNNVSTYNWVDTIFLKIADMFSKANIVSMISGNRTQIESEISGNISSLNSSLDSKINNINSSLQTNIDNANYRINSVNVTGKNISIQDVNVAGVLNSSTIYKVSDSGLIASWDFNSQNLNDNIIYDTSGYSRIATNNGSTYNYLGGYNGGGDYEFNGTSGYLYSDPIADINVNKNYTITGWFKANPSSVALGGFGTIISQKNGTNNIMIITIADGSLRGNNNNGTNIGMAGSINSYLNAGQWYFFSYSYAGNGSKEGQMVINGVLQTGVPTVGSSSTEGLTIGMREPSTPRFINGSIDDIRVYNRFLSVEESKNIYYQRAETSDKRKKYTGEVTVCKDSDCDYVVRGNADDEINSAINYLCTRNAGKILIKTGIYNVVNPLNISCGTGIVIEGESRGVGTFNDNIYDFSGGTIIRAVSGFPTDGSVFFVAANGTGIRDLVVDGNNIAAYGIQHYRGWEKYVENVMLLRNTNTGFFASMQSFGSENAGSGNWLSHVTSANNGQNGFFLNKSDYRIDDLYGWNHWNGSFIVLNQGGQQINTIHSYWSKYGIYVNGASDNSIVSAVLEGTNISAVYFDSTVNTISDFTITSSAMYLNDRYYLGNPIFKFNAPKSIRGILIEGNTFDDWDSITAKMFDYNISQDANIQDCYVSDNIYYHGLGNVPSNCFVGERKISSADVALDLNFDTLNSFNPNYSFDNSINNYDVLVKNATYNYESTSFRGGYYSVDGVSSYVSIPNVKPVNGNISVSLWVKTENLTQKTVPIISKSKSSGALTDFRITIGSSGYLGFGTSNIDTATPTTTAKFNDNKWHHIVAVIDQNNHQYLFYFDGDLNYSDYNSYNESRRSYETSNVTIGFSEGNYFGNTYFNGSIDNVKMFNRILSPTEVRVLFEEDRKAQDTYGIGKYGGSVYGDLDILGILNLIDPPVKCPNGTFMTQFLGSSSICTSASSVPLGNISVYNINKSGILFPNSQGTSSDSLVSYLDGNILYDYALPGNNISFNSNSYGTGKFGRGYIFNGTGSYINISNNNSYSFSKNFSVVMWFKEASTTQQILFTKVGSSTNVGDYQAYIQNGNNIIFRYVNSSGGTPTFTKTVSYTSNTWNFFVISINDTSINYFLNGNFLSSDSLQGDIVSTINNSFLWGYRLAGTLPFNGTMDELMIFNRSLSNDEIISLYEKNYEIAPNRNSYYFKGIDLNPIADSIYNIGSSGLRFLKGWFVNLDVSGTATLKDIIFKNSSTNFGFIQSQNNGILEIGTYGDGGDLHKLKLSVGNISSHIGLHVGPAGYFSSFTVMRNSAGDSYISVRGNEMIENNDNSEDSQILSDGNGMSLISKKQKIIIAQNNSLIYAQSYTRNITDSGTVDISGCSDCLIDTGNWGTSAILNGTTGGILGQRFTLRQVVSGRNINITAGKSNLWINGNNNNGLNNFTLNSVVDYCDCIVGGSSNSVCNCIDSKTNSTLYPIQIDWVYTLIGNTGTAECDSLDSKVGSITYTCQTCVDTSGGTVACGTTLVGLNANCACKID